MCPVCIATAAVLAGKATSAGWLTALVVRRIHVKSGASKAPNKS